MRKKWKKGLTLFLSAAMVLSNNILITFAEDTELVTEAAAQTEAKKEKTTEAPTEAVTEAPTEAATEAPTEAATEAPTEAVTEASPETEPLTEVSPETEAEKKEAESESESETEKETETETEDENIYIIEEKDVIITVEVPENMKLPEGAELVVEQIKNDSKEGEKDINLISLEYEVKDSAIYELHFEKNKQKLKLDDREKKDIKISFAYEADKLFDGMDYSIDDVKIFHLREMTKEELLEKEVDSDSVIFPTETTDERIAEVLKTKVEKEEDSKVCVSASTDGFSDYVVGYVKKKDMDTEKEPEEADEDTADPEKDEPDKTAETVAKIKVSAVGEVGDEENEAEVNILVPEELIIDETKLKISTDKGEVIPEINGKTIKVMVPLESHAGEIRIEGLPEGTYEINAGGNILRDGLVEGNSNFYSEYSTDGKIVINSEKEAELSIKNIYSVLSISSSGDDKPTKKIPDIEYAVKQAGKTVRKITADKSGNATLKGLPEGKYTIEVTAATIPAIYLEEKLSSEVEIKAEKYKSSVDFTFTALSLTLKAVDEKTDKPLRDVYFEVKDASGNAIKEKVDEKGKVTLKGVLERNTSYTITQTNAKGYFSPKSDGKVKDSKYVFDNVAEQVLTYTSRPTVLTIAVKDDVSQTSPYAGSYIAGATIEIYKYANGKVGELVKTVTSVDGITSLVGELNPGNYYLVQTSAPAGYLKSNVAKIRALTSKSGDKEAVFSDDTTKVLVSRKGYDSRKEVNGKYEYTNLKLVEGAELEIRNADGTPVTDKNGKNVTWKSSDKEGYLIEGILEAGTKYKVVENKGPIAYEKFTGGEFTTYTSGNTAKVTIPTRKGAGKVTVAVKSIYGTSTLKMSGTYYVALYQDSECKNLNTATGVKTINLNPSAVYSQVTFENVAAGKYYVSECDSSGNAIANGKEYSISYENKELTLRAGASILSVITHTYNAKPNGSQVATSEETQNANSGLYSGFGGSQQAASEMAAGGGSESVKTGDTTDIGLYIGLFAGALILIIILLILMKRKHK